MSTPEPVLNYVNGFLEPAVSGRVLDVLEPATGSVYTACPDSEAQDVAKAVAAARDAFPDWSRTPATERSRILLRIANRIEAELEPLALAESRDSGKPVKVARMVDIPRASANFRFFATAILHQETEAHQTDHEALNVTLRQPRGVAGCISPWNLPLYLFTWKIAPALATGNTVVGKPSEVTPYTAFLLSKICIEEGLPPGVLNVVHGRGPTAGAALVAHPDVPALSFTGSTRAGAEIGQVAASLFKKVSLELGGKNPTVVFGDVDLKSVVPQTVRASFANQGEICLCGSRILVEASIFEDFVERFVHAVEAYRVGDPLDSATDLGALVSREHLEKVQSYVALATQEGGTVLRGGKPPSGLPDRVRGGYFLEPAVITGLPPGCRTMTEEIFGPVVTITPFSDETEAIAIANETPYGLAASVWTRDLQRAHRVAGAIEAGIVWVNCWMLRDLRTPFGGTKQSGVGREGGTEALRFFTESKNVCFKL